MTRSARKFISAIMLLWLPVFTGSALAATIPMQLPHGECHDSAMSHESMKMGNMDMGKHHMHQGIKHATTDENSPNCSSCGVCHLACTGYLAVPGADILALQAVVLEITPYLVVFKSFTSAPLVPPPLVRT